MTTNRSQLNDAEMFEGLPPGQVTLAGKAFSPGPSLKVANHSPTGFAWGYGGSGPQQLALAILLAVSDRDTALEVYGKFKWEVVAIFPPARGWRMRVGDVRAWIRRGAWGPCPFEILGPRGGRNPRA